MNPLDQLKDIHLSEQVGLWPLAYGWWILMALGLAAVAAMTVFFLRSRRLGLARRQALQQLTQIRQEDTDWPQQVNTLMKRLAVSYYPEQNVAGLHSQHWLAFLADQLPEKKQATFKAALSTLQSSLYQSRIQVDAATVMQQAEVWIKHATPSKMARRQQHV